MQRHNDYIHYESDEIARILRKPLIGAVAARLAQADAIRVFQTTLIYKPPRPDEVSNIVPVALRQALLVDTSTSERMLTAFIPFHDCDEEMGTITMVDGSHLWKETGINDTVVKHFAERDNSDLEVMLAENAAFNNTEVDEDPDDHPQGAHELPPLPHVPRQRRQRAAAARAGRSRCTCRTGDNEYRQYPLSPTAARSRTTTTCWSARPPTAGRTTPTRSTARSSGPGNRHPTSPLGSCHVPLRLGTRPTPGSPG